jgi:hypothetical protein
MTHINVAAYGETACYYTKQDSSVDIVPGYGPDSRGLIPGQGKGFLSSPQCPDRLWGPLGLL